MKTRIIAIIICLLMLASLCSCGGEQQGVVQQPPEPVDTTPQTRIYNEGEQTEFTTLRTFGSDGYEKNLVWWSCDMTDVKLISVLMNEDGSYSSNEIALYSADTLAKGEALLLDVDVPEGMPNTALQATNNGVQQTWVLGYNGNIGGISLMLTTLDAGAAPSDSTDSEPVSGQSNAIQVFYLDDNVETLLVSEITLGSYSAESVWDAIKQKNPVIPSGCVLNSFTVDNYNIGLVDISDEIYTAQVGGGVEALMLDAIANTFIEAFELDAINLTVDGGVYESGHMILDTAIEFTQY